MTMPTGLVKSTIHASGFACATDGLGDPQDHRHRAQRLGESAGPVVSCPMHPHSCGNVSSPWRAACPPTRSWMSTASASDTPGDQVLRSRRSAPE